MQNSAYKLNIRKDNGLKGSVKGWFYNQIVARKLNSPLGYIILSVMTLAFSYAIATGGVKIGVLVIGALIGIPCILACMFNLQFGVTVVMIVSFFLLGIKRYVGDVPLGVGLDLMIVVMFFGIVVKQSQSRDWSFIKSPVTSLVLVWIVFNLVQVGNPWASSRLAWVYTVRGMAGLMIMYFIALYSLNSLNFISWLIKLWIFMCTLAALYGLWQEFIGLPGPDMAWLTADEDRFKIIYQWGKIRKFSFLSDPTVFGILMAYTSVLCFVLMTGPHSLAKKVLLGIAGFLMSFAMLYTGTRTAYVLIPVGMFFFALLTFKKNVLIVVGVLFAIGAVIVMMPTSNPTLYRFKSAFNPAESDSYQVREKNQAFIKPFIQAHPIGAGLGSVGVWGKKFSPNSPLANFPPDSGYVKIAVEQGWIGLGLYCWLLFVILKSGIQGYFRTYDPKLKNFYLALLCMLYSLVIANFPQDAITQVPTSLMFYVTAAMLVKLKNFDTRPSLTT